MFVQNICIKTIVAIFFSAISEIDENFKGVLVKIREVLRNFLFRDKRHLAWDFKTVKNPWDMTTMQNLCIQLNQGEYWKAYSHLITSKGPHIHTQWKLRSLMLGWPTLNKPLSPATDSIQWCTRYCICPENTVFLLCGTRIDDVTCLTNQGWDHQNAKSFEKSFALHKIYMWPKALISRWKWKICTSVLK